MTKPVSSSARLATAVWNPSHEFLPSGGAGRDTLALDCADPSPREVVCAELAWKHANLAFEYRAYEIGRAQPECSRARADSAHGWSRQPYGQSCSHSLRHVLH